MAAKRARNSKGHYLKDDPTTPDVNEAYEQDPSTKAKRAKANKPKEKSPAWRFFVSATPETAAFDIRVGEDAVRVEGIWDADRAYVTWRCPAELSDLMKLHHHVWSGRIIAVDDD